MIFSIHNHVHRIYYLTCCNCNKFDLCKIYSIVPGGDKVQKRRNNLINFFLHFINTFSGTEKVWERLNKIDIHKMFFFTFFFLKF